MAALQAAAFPLGDPVKWCRVKDSNLRSPKGQVGYSHSVLTGLTQPCELESRYLTRVGGFEPPTHGDGHA